MSNQSHVSVRQDQEDERVWWAVISALSFLHMSCLKHSGVVILSFGALFNALSKI